MDERSRLIEVIATVDYPKIRVSAEKGSGSTADTGMSERNVVVLGAKIIQRVSEVGVVKDSIALEPAMS